jgi:uncharacterized protein YjeT (DUF2065 family)
MRIFLYSCLLVICLLTIAGSLYYIVDPRKAWRRLQAPYYKNPEAQEPSNMAYANLQLQSVIGLLLSVGLVFVLIYGIFYEIQTEKKNEQLRQEMEQWSKKNPQEQLKELRRKYNVP